MGEQRKTKRFFTRVPVRVRGLDELGQTFSEDTTTMEINRDGARVALRSVPRFGSGLELTNLARNLTASSLVTHRCPQSYSGLPEWGLEFSEPVPDFWGIAFEESKEEEDCGYKYRHRTTFEEGTEEECESEYSDQIQNREDQ